MYPIEEAIEEAYITVDRFKAGPASKRKCKCCNKIIKKEMYKKMYIRSNSMWYDESFIHSECITSFMNKLANNYIYFNNYTTDRRLPAVCEHLKTGVHTIKKNGVYRQYEVVEIK